MNAILVVVGFIVLVAGHLSRWIYAGAMGLLLGSLLLPMLNGSTSQVDWIISSLACGLLCALLAAYFKRLVVAAAAFTSGAYVSYYLPGHLGWETDWLSLNLALLVGCAAASSYWLWGEIPLIAISSLTGATLIIQYLSFGSINSNIMFAILLVFGIAAQWIMWQYGHAET